MEFFQPEMALFVPFVLFCLPKPASPAGGKGTKKGYFAQIED